MKADLLDLKEILRDLIRVQEELGQNCFLDKEEIKDYIQDELGYLILNKGEKYITNEQFEELYKQIT
jgi:hypothetical protein